MEEHLIVRKHSSHKVLISSWLHISIPPARFPRTRFAGFNKFVRGNKIVFYEKSHFNKLIEARD